MTHRNGSLRGSVLRIFAAACGSAVMALSAPVSALQFELDYGDGITGTLNTAVTIGGAIRLQDRASHLIGKANLRGLQVDNGTFEVTDLDNDGDIDAVDNQLARGICPGTNQTANPAVSGNCQALFRAQTSYLAGVNAPGAASPNFDDGNLNFEQGDFVQQIGKVLQDLTLNYGDFGLFARWNYFHDYAQLNLLQYHPNQIGANTAALGPAATSLPVNPLNLADTLTNLLGGGGLPAVQGPRDTFGPGETIRDRVTDPEEIKQAGTSFNLYDLNLFGFFDMSTIPLIQSVPWLGEREIAFKVGRQTVSWGESTLLALNSLNQVNPIDANAFFRTGFAVEEIFSPIGMVFLATDITENLGIEMYYQWEWEPLIAPAPGSFFSFTDLGTNNSGRPVGIQFGTAAEDPLRRAGALNPLDSGLNGLTNSSLTLIRGLDVEPRDSGQYGVSLKYFAEDFNNGTELGFYFLNYHSKLPYASFNSTNLSCARALERPDGTFDPNGSNIDANATDVATFGLSCPDIPLFSGSAATDDAVLLDGVGIFLEYPEDRHLYGLSFNTTVGDWSIQGEVAYRPNLPIQVDAEDLTFAALGPTLSACHRRADGAGAAIPTAGTACSGTTLTADPTFGSSDSDPAAAGGGQGDTFSLLIGAAPGSARSFPNFVLPYRSLGDLRVRGENAPNSYIRGFEEMGVLQYNFAGTYILGAADNPIGADQVIIVGELGATQVLNMPELPFLQFESPGTFLHASAGADGTGADGSRQSQQVINQTDFPEATVGGQVVPAGADGLRFNPSQQNLEGYADKLAWGYRLITIIKYENVLPGWGIEPFLVFGHDVNGTGIGPGENFVEDRKIFAGNVQFRYKAAFSFNVGYQVFTGGDPFNVVADRDVVNFFAKMLF